MIPQQGVPLCPKGYHNPELEDAKQVSGQLCRHIAKWPRGSRLAGSMSRFGSSVFFLASLFFPNVGCLSADDLESGLSLKRPKVGNQKPQPFRPIFGSGYDWE